MGYGVYAGGCRCGCGQGHGEVDVVDDRPREDLAVVRCSFVAIFGFAEGWGHFATGVGGWDADVWEAGVEGDGFA